MIRAHRLSRRLKAGTVVVYNVWGSDITNPFGGDKQSGIGRDKSLHAMDKYCQVKNTDIQLQAMVPGSAVAGSKPG